MGWRLREVLLAETSGLALLSAPCPLGGSPPENIIQFAFRYPLNTYTTRLLPPFNGLIGMCLEVLWLRGATKICKRKDSSVEAKPRHGKTVPSTRQKGLFHEW